MTSWVRKIRIHPPPDKEDSFRFDKLHVFQFIQISSNSHKQRFFLKVPFSINQKNGLIDITQGFFRTLSDATAILAFAPASGASPGAIMVKYLHKRAIIVTHTWMQAIQ